jgi:hypothetical protein
MRPIGTAIATRASVSAIPGAGGSRQQQDRRESQAHRYDPDLRKGVNIVPLPSMVGQFAHWVITSKSEPLHSLHSGAGGQFGAE